MYPNPVKNNLSVHYNLNPNSSPASYIIMDISGRRVCTGPIDVNSTFVNINVAHLSKGIYYVQIFNGKETMRTKFIKE
ncbi:T9SS type A sorting domain-containing protein [Panacibacter microcysteis]|uniref:T9SS type A sorting domain-containing protein n=1 Tax=Panacibacter microcysteis TaxID=2793269 RepID=UPI003D15FA7F